MSDFASILADIRDRALERAATSPPTARVRARLGLTAQRAAPNAWEARRSYAAHAAREQSIDEAPDAAALHAAIRAAGGDALRLRALRRLAARALHPDRGGDGAALARCNAMIDAALRTSRRKT